MTREEKIISEAKKYFKDDINCYDAFLYGVEFAEDNQWISVEDDLPCNHPELLTDDGCTKDVLVLSEGYTTVAFMINSPKDWHWLYSMQVTHWMPIPEFPNHDDKH